jgi:hypothetical protein
VWLIVQFLWQQQAMLLLASHDLMSPPHMQHHNKTAQRPRQQQQQQHKQWVLHATRHAPDCLQDDVHCRQHHLGHLVCKGLEHAFQHRLLLL